MSVVTSVIGLGRQPAQGSHAQGTALLPDTMYCALIPCNSYCPTEARLKTTTPPGGTLEDWNMVPRAQRLLHWLQAAYSYHRPLA